ncbi:MAG: GTPase Era [Anaerolineae bacterium]|nr:GTPase Era [Anaerolineae bacterium]MDW8171476.1 GTPase Era [Anaerolineae bacterium]
MSDIDSIFSDDWPADHRSGIVAIVGRPNAGKSTLVNALLGQKIAIVAPKPQTTRTRQLGIHTTPRSQILFMDTPGLHEPHNKLGEMMLESVFQALNDADAILWIVDASQPPNSEDQRIAQALSEHIRPKPVLLALNKADLGSQYADAYRALFTPQAERAISALNNQGVAELIPLLVEWLPLGPRYFPAEQVSDANMRLIAAEIIREKVIFNTEKEIPYSVAVKIDEYREAEERTFISATLYVERDSQKGILIGAGGKMIKTIGTQARQELMTLLETPVHLELNVKVLKDWRDDEVLMRRIGYHMPKEDDD